MVSINPDEDLVLISTSTDIVGIPEEDTWEYSETLATIIEERGFSSLKLQRVMDLVGLTDGQRISKQTYLSLTDTSRTILLQAYGKSKEEIRAMIETDNDTLMTYRGFIRFLENDLRYEAAFNRLPGPCLRGNQT